MLDERNKATLRTLSDESLNSKSAGRAGVRLKFNYGLEKKTGVGQERLLKQQEALHWLSGIAQRIDTSPCKPYASHRWY